MQCVDGGGRRPLHAAGAGAALLAFAALGLAGCGSPTVDSRPLDHPVTIDGNAADWEGSLYSLEGGKVMAGFKNDGTNLYVCLGSDDRAIQRQILARGLTVWFDPAGGKAKTFGIRFPLAEESPRERRAAPEDRRDGSRSDGFRSTAGPGDGPERRGRGFDLDSAVKALQDSGAELELIEGGAPPDRMFVEQAAGIEIRMGMSEGSLVYELRVPLVKDATHPYGIGEKIGKTIGFGAESPKLDRQAMQDRFRGRPFPGSVDGFSFGQDGRWPGGGGGGGPDGGWRGGRRGGEAPAVSSGPSRAAP